MVHSEATGKLRHILVSSLFRKRRKVLLEVKDDRHAPYPAIAEKIEDTTRRQVKYIAVRRHCRQATTAVSHATNHSFPPASSKKCEEWAKTKKDFPWNTVLWTDEAILELGEHVSRQYVTRKVGKKYLPETIEPTFRSGRKTIMLWGVVAEGRKRRLA